MKIKKCPICNKFFIDRHSCKNRTQVYCSSKCYAETIIKWKTCAHCGKKFHRYGHGEPTHGFKYCSRKCSNLGRTGRPLTLTHRKALSKAKRGKPILHFINNKEEIGRKLSKKMRGRKCPWSTGSLHPMWKGGKTFKACPVCGKWFWTYNEKHCSIQCANKSPDAYNKIRHNPSLDLHNDPPKHYKWMHTKIGRLFGKPSFCEECGTHKKRKYVWANTDHQYNSYKRIYWKRMCIPCHHKYDKINHERKDLPCL